MSFEIRSTDLAARIGLLATPHGVVETPAFVPVVHPVRQTISPSYLKGLGFHALITNAYLTLRHYGDYATKRGIHDILNYDGTIMTDSGGYQVLEYGSVQVEPLQIAQFQKNIKSDICIPLDKPTGYGLKYQEAKNYVQQTLKNAKDTLAFVSSDRIEDDEQECSTHYRLWLGPIQGGEHSDLVSYSADCLDKMGFNIFGLGSPVELMEAYEFSLLSKMIYHMKRTVPSKPVHLFGAGHPITIPLVIALGCDTFDSASYIIYARDNRYMHTNGTVRLEEISYFPCYCSICSKYTVREMIALDTENRTVELAKHNLHVLKAEVSAVKEAIMQGRLWEYIMQKARAHPKLFDAIQLFKNFDILEEGTPIFKDKALFLFDPIDQYRPELRRFRRIVAEFHSKNKKLLVLYPEVQAHPFYSTKEYRELIRKFSDAQICAYNPFFGIIPAEICDIYPASHNLTTKSASLHHAEDFPTFTESLLTFLRSNHFEQIIIVADSFMREVIDIEDNMIVRDPRVQILDYKQYNIPKL